jgi:hypothetical protein
MKILHGVLHGKLWIRVHGLLKFASSTPPRGGPGANFGRPGFFLIIFLQDRLQGTFQDKQTSPSDYLKLIEFETNYTKTKPSPLFPPTKHAMVLHMVHSHVTQCLRAHDYIKQLSQHPWYGLWMTVEGPHHYKVTALGSCVKWP